MPDDFGDLDEVIIQRISRYNKKRTKVIAELAKLLNLPNNSELVQAIANTLVIK